MPLKLKGTATSFVCPQTCGQTEFVAVVPTLCVHLHVCVCVSTLLVQQESISESTVLLLPAKL